MSKLDKANTCATIDGSGANASVGECVAIVDWLMSHLPGLLESGDNWKLTLHGGKGGDVKVEVMQVSDVLPAKGHRGRLR